MNHSSMNLHHIDRVEISRDSGGDSKWVYFEFMYGDGEKFTVAVFTDKGDYVGIMNKDPEENLQQQHWAVQQDQDEQWIEENSQ